MNNECLAARFLLGEIIAGWTSIDIRSRRPKAELWPDRHDPELQLFPQAPVRSTESQKTVVRRQLPCTTPPPAFRSEEHMSELQSRRDLVCRLLLEKKKHHKQHGRPDSKILNDQSIPRLRCHVQSNLCQH